MEIKPLRILLADDDEGDRLFFKDAFEELKIGSDVQTVNDGIALMDYLTINKANLPNLIFLDLNMPQKNGIECLKEIKGNPIYKDISIVIFSTSSSQKDIETTFLHGANVYIKKPNNFNQLKKVLEKAVTYANQYHVFPLNRDNFMLFAE